MPIISGYVESGRKLGRTLGFPTANVALDSSISVPSGVYLSRIQIEGGEWLQSITNIGVNPTIDTQTALRSESYIFDFEGDIYGKQVAIELLDHLRDEIQFNSIEELQKQIREDVNQARLAHNPPRI